MVRRYASMLAAAGLSGCAAMPAAFDAASDVRVTPDRPGNPASVRFEVPTALLMELPGARVPTTLQARMSTRELAARELAAAGYCPNGFTGPEGIHFPGGDRSRSVFVVRCIA